MKHSAEEITTAAAFRTELRRFLKRTQEVAEAAGLTPQRYDLLLMVAAEGESTVTALCESLQLGQTAVTELVNRSVAAGLLQRRVSPDDGRVSLLRLTAEGERRLGIALATLREDRIAFTRAFADVAAKLEVATRL